jgi:Fic family protein
MRFPDRPPNFSDLIVQFPPDGDWIESKLYSPTDAKGRYLHWDQLKHKKIPAGLSREKYWAIMRLARLAAPVSVPLRDKEGALFSFAEPGSVKKSLHEIDSAARGNISVPEAIVNQETRKQYLVRSLIEEAFSSSFLEGAVTTRRAAKEMIRKDKEPANKSERMVYNNYKAIQFINENKSEDLTPEIVCEIHRLITQGTLDREEMSGKFRAASDNINVVDDETGEIFHKPPAAEQLNDRMKELCDFANAVTSDVEFIHPLVRSIILHFMLAYDHPFVDGNGRTARALFYWSALKSGYWILEYASISSVLLNAPAKYARSFLYTETDGSDLTYFIVHQLEVIGSAMKELEKYLALKSDELKKFVMALERAEIRTSLNHRQIQLLEDSIRHPGVVYTIKEHAQYHGVSYLTARGDLARLYELRLFRKLKEGSRNIYIADKGLTKRISPGS